MKRIFLLFLVMLVSGFGIVFLYSCGGGGDEEDEEGDEVPPEVVCYRLP